MRTPPSDLSDQQIAAALARAWNLHAGAIDYLPLGFGSHHWAVTLVDGGRRFITVDDLCSSHLSPDTGEAFRRLRTAYATAATLRDQAGLSFVVAPLVTTRGNLLERLGARYALAVFPYLDTAPVESGEFRDMADRDAALRQVGEVHNATPRTPVSSLRRDTLCVPRSIELREALETTGDPWLAGPFGEPARHLLRDSSGKIREGLRTFANLRRAVVADHAGWVVTHGEPHAANVIRTRANDLVMVDWDTVALGPRERDLWHFVNQRTPDWAAYRAVTGVEALSPAVLDVYRLHWALSEIACYVAWCRAPHTRSAEMEIAWRELRAYVAGLDQMGASGL